jgi:hypothetical protein
VALYLAEALHHVHHLLERARRDYVAEAPALRPAQLPQLPVYPVLKFSVRKQMI